MYWDILGLDAKIHSRVSMSELFLESDSGSGFLIVILKWYHFWMADMHEHHFNPFYIALSRHFNSSPWIVLMLSLTTPNDSWHVLTEVLISMSFRLHVFSSKFCNGVPQSSWRYQISWRWVSQAMWLSKPRIVWGSHSATRSNRPKMG